MIPIVAKLSVEEVFIMKMREWNNRTGSTWKYLVNKLVCWRELIEDNLLVSRARSQEGA